MTSPQKTRESVSSSGGALISACSCLVELHENRITDTKKRNVILNTFIIFNYNAKLQNLLEFMQFNKIYFKMNIFNNE